MRSTLAKIILEVAAVLALAFLLNSCGGQPHCPTCGTTVNGAYSVINVVPVPEHNPTGEPGGPFNSFDISWFDPIQQRVYTSDRSTNRSSVVFTGTKRVRGTHRS